MNLTEKLTAALRPVFPAAKPFEGKLAIKVRNEILKDEADRLAPLHLALVECVKALEFMTMPITGKTPTVESLQDTIANDDARGNKALARLAEVLLK